MFIPSISSPLSCVILTHIDPLSCVLIQHSYGPFTVDGGTHTSPSNAEFDASLRQRNTLWGYRDVEDIRAQAAGQGLMMVECITMPANNFCLVFKKAK